MIKLRRYYTFNDIIKAITEGEAITGAFDAFKAANAHSDDPLLAAQTYNNAFADVFNNLLMGYGKWAVTWADYVPPFEERPGDLDYSEDIDEITDFMRKVAYIYNNTQDRYLVLLGLYNDNKTNLLNKITTDTKTRYNDTPQNGGDWSDDNHTSNITQSTSETDISPLIDRLDEIDKKYRNLVKDWAKEFRGLFMTPEVRI